MKFNKVYSLQEGFWYRSFPMGLGVGITSFYLVRTGQLKPNKYFGAAPKVFLSSFVAYWAGKISYVLSDECKEKFLKDAPESETAYYIRKDRGLQQPWTALRDFGQEDTEEDDDVNVLHYIIIEDDECFLCLLVVLEDIKSCGIDTCL